MTLQMCMRRKPESTGVSRRSVESTDEGVVAVERMRLFRCLALKVNNPAAAARMLAKLRKVAPPSIDACSWVRGYPLRD